jgi:hypothetical protein
MLSNRHNRHADLLMVIAKAENMPSKSLGTLASSLAIYTDIWPENYKKTEKKRFLISGQIINVMPGILRKPTLPFQVAA